MGAVSRWSALLVGFVGSLSPSAVLAQAPVWSTPTPPGSGGGNAVAAYADVNQDGIADLLAGLPSFSGLATDAGRALVLSGVDGTTLRIWDGNPGSRLGEALSIAGDIDLDGVPDALLGAPGATTLGIARVYSGATGALLESTHGTTLGSRYGAAVAGGQDLNGDGIADYVVGAPMDAFAPNARGRVTAFSGATGFALWTSLGATSADAFGATVAMVDDYDFDGAPEVAATTLFASPSFPPRVISGAAAASSYPLLSASTGTRIADAGDVDVDGIRDILVSEPSYTIPGGICVSCTKPSAGRVWLVSGATTLPILHFEGRGAQDLLGSSMGPAGDVNGDAAADFILGSAGLNATDPAVELYSGKTLLPYMSLSGSNCSFAAAYTGDLTGDGIAELAVGSVCGPFSAGTIALHSVGTIQVTPVGSETPGCSGPHAAAAIEPPRLGGPFGMSCYAAPPASLGLLLITNVLSPIGSDPLQLGLTFYTDLATSTEIYGLDMPSDALGHGMAQLNIPMASPLIGKSYAMQGLWAWSPSACQPSTYGLSATRGFSFTIFFQ